MSGAIHLLPHMPSCRAQRRVYIYCSHDHIRDGLPEYWLFWVITPRRLVSSYRRFECTKTFETSIVIRLSTRRNISEYLIADISDVYHAYTVVIVETPLLCIFYWLSLFQKSSQCISYKRPALTVGILFFSCVLRYLFLLSYFSDSMCFCMALWLCDIVDYPPYLLFLCFFVFNSFPIRCIDCYAVALVIC